MEAGECCSQPSTECREGGGGVRIVTFDILALSKKFKILFSAHFSCSHI